jgi:hypothetical protein
MILGGWNKSRQPLEFAGILSRVFVFDPHGNQRAETPSNLRFFVQNYNKSFGASG